MSLFQSIANLFSPNKEARHNRAIKELETEIGKRIQLGTLLQLGAQLCESDSSTHHYKLGAEVTVVFDDNLTLGKIRDTIPELRDLNNEIAKKYSLVIVGRGPFVGEMGMNMVCLGFRHD